MTQCNGGTTDTGAVMSPCPEGGSGDDTNAVASHARTGHAAPCTVRTVPGRLRALTVSHSESVFYGGFAGFARRLTAQNGGFRPGQCPRAGRPVPGPECSVDWGTNVFRAPTADGPWTLTAPLLDVNKVRKAPSRPRTWANSSLFELHSHRNAWANLFRPT